MNGSGHSSAGQEPATLLVADVVIDEDANWPAFASGSSGSDAEGVEALVHAAVAAVSSRDGLMTTPSEAAIALATDGEVAALNTSFRGKPKPTNVLSFPAGPMPGPAEGTQSARRFLGDIILARETVWREAAEQDIPPAHHLQHLVIHGLLHLLGYDHETDAEAGEMEKLETSLLSGLGIADPYTAPLEE